MILDLKHRVAVVTGGGGGIGTATALELARRGAVVIAVDPGVGVQGEPLGEPTAAQTAKLIEANGGTARSSTASVTDAGAIASLFDEVNAEFGSLDIVVNTAGVLRFATLPDASEDDWWTVLNVHLNGYLNVLSQALPRMADAGYGRIVGFTSGVGNARTSVQGPAYGSAKRAVAALTRQIGKAAPPGVAVNALSPIAATRMVKDAVVASGVSPKGLDLSAMPQAEDMAPAAALLASESFGWCRGEVIFSAGPELSVVAPPTLIEGIRTTAADLPSAFGTLFPVVLTPAESLQGTTGGSNPRFGPVFSQSPAPAATGGPAAAKCLVVCEDDGIAGALTDALARWNRAVVGVGSSNPFDAAARRVPTTFADAEAVLARAEQAAGPVDTVIVVLEPGDTPRPAAPTWRQLLDAHRDTAGAVLAHAAWSHAVARHALATGRAARVLHVVRAHSPAGRTAAEAVTQLARSFNDTPMDVPVEAFAIGLESADSSDHAPLAHLCARLALADDASGLAGAELAVMPGWIALRRHPGPIATVSFGERDIPAWAAESVREAIGYGTGRTG